MRILIIDDSEDSRDITEGALLSAGYDDVVTAASGWEALKLIFYSANPQAVECTWKSAPTKRLGTTFRMISRDWDQVSVT